MTGYDRFFFVYNNPLYIIIPQYPSRHDSDIATKLFYIDNLSEINRLSRRYTYYVSPRFFTFYYVLENLICYEVPRAKFLSYNGLRYIRIHMYLYIEIGVKTMRFV